MLADDWYARENDDDVFDPYPARITALPGRKVVKVAASHWNTFVVTMDVKGLSPVTTVMVQRWHVVDLRFCDSRAGDVHEGSVVPAWWS